MLFLQVRRGLIHQALVQSALHSIQDLINQTPTAAFSFISFFTDHQERKIKLSFEGVKAPWEGVKTPSEGVKVAYESYQTSV
jgi:hypothetical protein